MSPAWSPPYFGVPFRTQKNKYCCKFFTARNGKFVEPIEVVNKQGLIYSAEIVTYTQVVACVVGNSCFGCGARGRLFSFVVVSVVLCCEPAMQPVGLPVG